MENCVPFTQAIAEYSKVYVKKIKKNMLLKKKLLVIMIIAGKKLILLILSLIKFSSYVLNTVLTPKFIIKMLTILLMILLHGGDTAHLDETDSESESGDEKKPKQDKGKGVDTGIVTETSINKTALNNDIENTEQDKTKEAGKPAPASHQPGTVSETMLKIYKMMADHENALLEAEKAEFERTSELPQDNLHDKISEFRKDDEAEMKIIRDKLEKARLEDTPGDVGSSVNKRELIVEEDQVENKKIKEDTSDAANKGAHISDKKDK